MAEHKPKYGLQKMHLRRIKDLEKLEDYLERSAERTSGGLSQRLAADARTVRWAADVLEQARLDGVLEDLSWRAYDNR